MFFIIIKVTGGGEGIVKLSKAKEIELNEEMYLDVDMLTPVVTCEDELKNVKVAELKELLNRKFLRGG